MSISLPLAEVTQIGLFSTLTNTEPVFVPGTMFLQRKCGSGERTLTGYLSCLRIPTFYPLQGPTNSNMYQHFFLLLFCREKCAAYPGHQWGGGERTFGYIVVSPSCNCDGRMLSGLNVQGSMRKGTIGNSPAV
jgi:hypothetical protein